MKLLRLGVLPLTAVAALSLAGCSSEASIPSESPAIEDNEHYPVEHTLDAIEMNGKWACPVDSNGDLLVLSGRVSAEKDGSSITVNGIVISPGDTFYTGEVKEATDYKCGDKTYSKALVSQTEGVSAVLVP